MESERHSNEDESGTAASVRTTDPAGFENHYVSAAPKWDIGRPQPAFVTLAESGAISGRVIDVGCGTGEHVLMLAASGIDVTGIDTSAAAIASATAKARDRGLAPPFLVQDALRLADLGGRFDVAIDSGLFHVFSDEDRPVFAANVHAILRPGGRYFMLCFSDQQAPALRGPRRISRPEIEQSFADGWQINSIEPSRYVTTELADGAIAWLSDITRLSGE